MKADLAAAANSKATHGGGSFKGVWAGGQITLDESKFLDLVARTLASRMGNNLFRGLRPDGSGPMPPRKYDGQPRGSGSLISRAIAAIKGGALTWNIAAHREKIGHLARIMGDVPFRAPPIDEVRHAVHAAFEASVKLTQARAELPAAMPKPGLFGRVFGESSSQRAARSANTAARRAGRAVVADRRGEYHSLLRELGLTGESPSRSALGKRISSAARGRVRGRW